MARGGTRGVWQVAAVAALIGPASAAVTPLDLFGIGVLRHPFGETCNEVGPKLARFGQGERVSYRWIVQ